MSKLRHLSRGKIAKELQLRFRRVPADGWILLTALVVIGIIGEVTAYPGALIVCIVTALVLIFSEPS